MNEANSAMAGPEDGSDLEHEVMLDPRVQESIGRSLKAHYDDIVSAPVPDKFLVLLAQLEATEHRTTGGSIDELN